VHILFASLIKHSGFNSVLESSEVGVLYRWGLDRQTCLRLGWAIWPKEIISQYW